MTNRIWKFGQFVDRLMVTVPYFLGFFIVFGMVFYRISEWVPALKLPLQILSVILLILYALYRSMESTEEITGKALHGRV